MRRLPAALVLPLALLLGTATLATASPSAQAADGVRAERPASQQVASRGIVFDLVNAPYGLVETLSGCPADRRSHRVVARLVGPRQVVRGRAGTSTANVLVHDAGTGAWFWNLRSAPSLDYATQLARRGQTSVVLDRLGYGRSALRDGKRTCLDAQAHMLGQVVQHLRAGKFTYADGRGGSTQHFTKVVLQGHGTGALLSQLAAARYPAIAGVVLMSPPSTSPTSAALGLLGQQGRACLTASFAPFGASATDFKNILFASAPRAVQNTAAALRNSTPCGDVSSTAGALLASVLPTGTIPRDVPVLRLVGARDALFPRGDVHTGTSARTTTRVFARSGNALPLERDAAAVRGAVLRFLRTL
ncbi:alpha/beta hydrolase [Nocardioides sp. R-C-SC26]|uniref:alpha/beta hydrolase n=1 Tax=Nocardioides sp. R-C-SC26 TaxID=2870414 RepID=UPI001E40C4FC|nr:alpha/beta hydrolase [Nocardioides sp. R-C-SC26]